MMVKEPNTSTKNNPLARALSRWENEGGVGSRGPQESSISGEVLSEVPQLTKAELVKLRIRVIALENLVITLLAGASDRQLDLTREMAAYIFFTARLYPSSFDGACGSSDDPSC